MAKEERRKEERRYEERRERKVEDYGADLCKGLGTVSQGISRVSLNQPAEPLTALRNKFSAQHDTSCKEAMRMVGGEGTSFEENERE